MRKLLVVLPMLLPVLLALAGGCDSTRRDLTYCNETYKLCGDGKTCNYTTGLCVADVDAGAPDTNVTEASPPVDLAQGEAALGPDAADAPALVDVSPVDTSPVVDTSIIDAPQIVDVAIPDTRMPDAPGTCSVDNDCVGVTSGAFCVNTRCVACKTSSQCNNDAGVPFCSAQNTCVSCAGASGADGGSACPATAPLCAPSGSCVECVGNSDCPQSGGKAFCVQNKCQGCNVPGATASAPSAGSTDAGAIDGSAPDSGTSANVGPCPGTKPVCATTGTIVGQCVGCVGDSDCGGTAPICSLTATSTIPANTCTACTSDSQCTTGPKICMFHQDATNGGGRCASAAETIYVQNTAGCISAGTSSETTPFCQPQTGINAVDAIKRLVVLTGTGTSVGAFSIWTASFTAGSPQVSIIGRNSPVIAPGAADMGIHVLGGNVYIRGLTVQGAGAAAAIPPSQPGILVDPSATIGLDRCYVMGNAGGLLVSDGAGFDIANSVFAQNISGSVGAAVFGGVYLGKPTAGSTLPHRFWFNTIADNQQFGIACATTTQTLDGCLLAGDTNGEVVNCTLAATTKSPNYAPSGKQAVGFTTDGSPPNFSATKPYHLVSTTYKPTTSPCKDFITDLTVLHPADDIDGQARPNGVGLDCGADEYWP
jgi:hypothetical protein